MLTVAGLWDERAHGGNRNFAKETCKLCGKAVCISIRSVKLHEDHGRANVDVLCIDDADRLFQQTVE
jgi:hypothetical protein